MGASDNAVHVACLCAAWCRLCDDYAPVMEAVMTEIAAQSGTELRRHWIDIEDEAELVGEVDVETFPTIVVVGPEGVRFAGPLTPQVEILRRLLRLTVLERAIADRPAAVSPEIHAFADRLRERQWC